MKKKQGTPQAPRRPLTQSERWLKQKYKVKHIRIAIQIVLMGLVIYIFMATVVFPPRYQPSTLATAVNGEGGAAASVSAEASRFICISYSGLTKSTALDSAIVSQRSFAEQLDALRASGYTTISQQDVADYYLYGSPLPEKSMLLLFEDGILDTSTLAQASLEKHNYLATMCTYAANLTDINSKFVTTEGMKRLLANSYWELGTNGYRLSYINIFDRYDNFFGNLNANQFVNINQYLKRDYNHYLMDFYRDEDYLRIESEAELNARFAYDYSQMAYIYESEIGYVPMLYILMHSNTGAFGTNAVASETNRDMLTSIFTMNFNRQGSCLNTRDSSIYDLSRLQVQPFFSTNQLLMRIWDDTGDDVAFVTGDAEEAANWYQDQGVTEYRQNEIILTTLPYGEGQMTLGTGLYDDVEVSATLNGNKVGVQSIYLRTDRSRSSGVQVSLENNDLIIRDLSAGGAELHRQNLFTFDGGPFISEQEDELNGLIDYNQMIVYYDEDPQRIAKAEKELERLKTLTAINIEEGGTPYYPDVDIAERDSRQLRIRLVGQRLSVWLDGRAVVENLSVSAQKRGNIALGAGSWWETDQYSQENIVSDVYDARFIDLTVANANDPAQIYYAYRLDDLETLQKRISDMTDTVVNFFLDFF